MLWIAVVICCGLNCRTEWLSLPWFFAKYAADALWALMFFLGFGLLLPARRTATAAGMAALVCATVEVSQLYHAPWIDEIRRTWFGRMALGDTFGWGDMAAYLVGIVVGAVAEWSVRRWLWACDKLSDAPPRLVPPARGLLTGDTDTSLETGITNR